MLNAEHMVAGSRASLEAWAELAYAAVGNTEKLATLQLQMLRAALAASQQACVALRDTSLHTLQLTGYTMPFNGWAAGDAMPLKQVGA